MAVSKNRRENKKKPPAARRKAAPLPDRRALEAMLAKLSGEPFDHGDGEATDPLGRAQDLMYDAWELSDKRARIALARKALEISDRCADAYVLLALETARDIVEERLLCGQGVAAGERAVGPEAFERDVGRFWGILDTRPYMRARQALAHVLWRLGERDAAIAHLRDMLRLNPNDNQGVRHVLVGWLLTVDDLDGVEALLAVYGDDGFAESAWARVLLAFRRGGASAAARTALASAREANPFVAGLLTGAIRIPKRIPDHYSFGSVDEAAAYVRANGETWSATRGALQWLAEASRNHVPAGKRR